MKTRQIKKRIRKLVKWWCHWTGLGYWHIDIKWENVIRMDHGGYDTAGLVECDWKYQRAMIIFGTDKIKEMNQSDLEMLVVHELMHIFLNETREKGIDHEERVATSLAKAFIWVKNAK